MQSIVVTGFPKHAPYLARLLNECAAGVKAVSYTDSRIDVLRAAAHALHADASISFGGPRTKELVQKVCDLRRRPVIIHWAGSDVLTISKHPAELERLRLAKIIHWTSGPDLVDELEILGIRARYVASASADIPKNICPLPGEFTVLTYLPEPRREFYGQSYVWEAAKALSDVRFIAVGRGGQEPAAPANVEYVGDVNDMNARYDSATVLLRLTQHDSLSQGVIEALAHGRHVIWTDWLPGCVHVESVDEAIDALRTLRAAHDESRLELNQAGINYVARDHAPARIAAGIVRAVNDAIDLTRSNVERPSEGTVRLAISGQEIFSSRIAANIRRHPTPISAQVLSVRNRSETGVSLLDLLASDVWYSIGQPVGPRPFELASAITRKRRVMHWLGNDVEMLRGNDALLRKFQSDSFVHLAQTDGVRMKLNELGLNVAVAPLAVVSPVSSVQPLPEQFTLLLYLPRERPEFYGRYQYERLMKALSAEPVRYIIVGGGRIDVPAGVLAEKIEWSHDLAQTYDRSTALLRFTEPDSASVMVIEALVHGRHVLWSNDFAFVTKVRSFHELEQGVRSLLKRHSAGELTAQFDAAQTMAALYSPQRCLTVLAAACGCRSAAAPAVTAGAQA